MILPERMDFPTQELPAWFCWLAGRRGGGLGEAEECQSKREEGPGQLAPGEQGTK